MSGKSWKPDKGWELAYRFADLALDFAVRVTGFRNCSNVVCSHLNVLYIGIWFGYLVFDLVCILVCISLLVSHSHFLSLYPTLIPSSLQLQLSYFLLSLSLSFYLSFFSSLFFALSLPLSPVSIRGWLLVSSRWRCTRCPVRHPPEELPLPHPWSHPRSGLPGWPETSRTSPTDPPSRAGTHECQTPPCENTARKRWK